MTKQVAQGQSVRLTVRFKDFSGNLGDPSTVTIWIERVATGGLTRYRYGTDAAVVKESTGIYHIDIDTSITSGQWNWRILGAGTINHARQGSFYVEPEYNTTIMADLLLPGYGSQVTDTISITEGGASMYTTVLDTSRCASLAVQVKTWAGNATLTAQAQQSFDGTNYADYGSSQTVVQGDILRFDLMSGPFGVFRVKFTNSTDNSETFTLVVVTTGFALPVTS